MPVHPASAARIENRMNRKVTLFENVDIVCEMARGDETPQHEVMAA